MDNGLNSGVQIRSQTKDGPKGRVNGPQVEIDKERQEWRRIRLYLRRGRWRLDDARTLNRTSISRTVNGMLTAWSPRTRTFRYGLTACRFPTSWIRKN